MKGGTKWNDIAQKETSELREGVSFGVFHLSHFLFLFYFFHLTHMHHKPSTPHSYFLPSLTFILSYFLLFNLPTTTTATSNLIQHHQMCDHHDWVNFAMADDSIVADLLLRLNRRQPQPSLQLHWTVRQRRSRSLPKHAAKPESTRISPTTPLSWNGATSPSEESSLPAKFAETSKSNTMVRLFSFLFYFYFWIFLFFRWGRVLDSEFEKVSQFLFEYWMDENATSRDEVLLLLFTFPLLRIYLQSYPRCLSSGHRNHRLIHLQSATSMWPFFHYLFNNNCKKKCIFN